MLVTAYSQGGIFMTESALCVFRFYVNAADSGFENADLGLVVCGFDHAGLFLDADDLTDDTADGGDLIANGQIVAHIVCLALLLFLRTNAEKVEYNEHSNDHHHHGDR